LSKYFYQFAKSTTTFPTILGYELQAQNLKKVEIT